MNPINRVAVMGLCSTLLALGACESNSVVEIPHRDLTGASVDMRTYDAMAQAVVAQQSLYPYHFEADAAGLNELGQVEDAAASPQTDAVRQQAPQWSIQVWFVIAVVGPERLP